MWVALCYTWVFGSVLGSRGDGDRYGENGPRGAEGFVVRVLSFISRVSCL